MEEEPKESFYDEDDQYLENDGEIKVKISIKESLKFGIGFGAGIFIWILILMLLGALLLGGLFKLFADSLNPFSFLF